MKRLARGQVGRAGGPLLRDRNKALYANPEKWDGEAAGSVREERMYYCTDHQGSVVALVGPDGALVEQARYSANGVPFGLPLGDVDADGDCDGADDTLHKAIEATGVYDVRGDLDLDGDVDSADWAIVAAGAGEVLGWGRLSVVSTASTLMSAPGTEYSILDSLGHLSSSAIALTLGIRLDACETELSTSAHVYYVCDEFVVAGDLVAQPLAPPVRPSPVTPGPLWPEVSPPVRPAAPTPPSPPPPLAPGGPSFPRPGPVAPWLAPLSNCVLIGCFAYCVGEAVSPLLYPPTTYIPPLRPPPPRPPRIPPADPMCDWAKRWKERACGAPGLPSPPFSCSKRMPLVGPEGTPQRQVYCDAARARFENGLNCLLAREAVTAFCYYGITNATHAAQEAEVLKAITKCQSLRDDFCYPGSHPGNPSMPIPALPYPIVPGPG